jgi:hypothetical protein
MRRILVLVLLVFSAISLLASNVAVNCDSGPPTNGAGLLGMAEQVKRPTRPKEGRMGHPGVLSYPVTPYGLCFTGA